MGNSAREVVFLLSRRWCMFPRLVSATVEARERAVEEGARAYKEAAVPTTSRAGSRASVTFGGRMTRAWCSRRNGTSQRPQWSPRAPGDRPCAAPVGVRLPPLEKEWSGAIPEKASLASTCSYRHRAQSPRRAEGDAGLTGGA